MAHNTPTTSSDLRGVTRLLILGVLLIVGDSLAAKFLHMEYSLWLPGLRIWAVGAAALVIGFIWTVVILLKRH
jgi:hypothetical protein